MVYGKLPLQQQYHHRSALENIPSDSRTMTPAAEAARLAAEVKLKAAMAEAAEAAGNF